MKLSILILTIPNRKRMFDKLINDLRRGAAIRAEGNVDLYEAGYIQAMIDIRQDLEKGLYNE